VAMTHLPLVRELWRTKGALVAHTFFDMDSNNSPESVFIDQCGIRVRLMVYDSYRSAPELSKTLEMAMTG